MLTSETFKFRFATLSVILLLTLWRPCDSLLAPQQAQLAEQAVSEPTRTLNWFQDVGYIVKLGTRTMRPDQYHHGGIVDLDNCTGVLVHRDLVLTTHRCGLNATRRDSNTRLVVTHPGVRWRWCWQVDDTGVTYRHSERTLFHRPVVGEHSIRSLSSQLTFLQLEPLPWASAIHTVAIDEDDGAPVDEPGALVHLAAAATGGAQVMPLAWHDYDPRLTEQIARLAYRQHDQQRMATRFGTPLMHGLGIRPVLLAVVTSPQHRQAELPSPALVASIVAQVEWQHTVQCLWQVIIAVVALLTLPVTVGVVCYFRRRARSGTMQVKVLFPNLTSRTDDFADLAQQIRTKQFDLVADALNNHPQPSEDKVDGVERFDMKTQHKLSQTSLYLNKMNASKNTVIF